MNRVAIHLVRRLRDDERGGATTEYAVVLGLVVLAIVALLSQFGGRVLARWNVVGQQLDGGSSSTTVVDASTKQTHVPTH